MKLHLAAVSAMALCMGLSACGDFPQPQYPVSRPLAPPPAPQAEPAPAPAPWRWALARPAVAAGQGHSWASD